MQITNAADRIADSLDSKRLRRPWNPDLHPRDSKGRFIETGGIARLWGGGLARVVRALGGRDVLVEDLSTRKQSTVHASRLTMVTRPDGTAPTKSKRKVRDEDERRTTDVRRGTGRDDDDPGDQGDTPDDPHDQDDQGDDIGEDVDGEDRGATEPEPEDDEPYLPRGGVFRDGEEDTQNPETVHYNNALPMPGSRLARHRAGQGDALRAPGGKPRKGNPNGHLKFRDTDHANDAASELVDDYLDGLSNAWKADGWDDRKARRLYEQLEDAVGDLIQVDNQEHDATTRDLIDGLPESAAKAEELAELADRAGKTDLAEAAATLSDALDLAHTRFTAHGDTPLRNPRKNAPARLGAWHPTPAAPAKKATAKRIRRDPNRRYKTLDDVRAHWANGKLTQFEKNEERHAAHREAMRSYMDRLDKPQLSRNGHFTIGKLPETSGNGPSGWAVTHNDTGIRMVTTPRKAEALDFANRMETAQLDGKPIDWNAPDAFDGFHTPEGKRLAASMAAESQKTFAERAVKKKEGATSRTKPATPTLSPDQQSAQDVAGRTGAPASNIGVGHIGGGGEAQDRPRNDVELREFWKRGGAHAGARKDSRKAQGNALRLMANDPNLRITLASHHGFAIVEDTSADDASRFRVLTSGAGRRLSGLGVGRIHEYGRFPDRETADRFALYLGSNLRDKDGRTLDWGDPNIGAALSTFRDKDGQPSPLAIWQLAGQFDRERGVSDSAAARLGRRHDEPTEEQRNNPETAPANPAPGAPDEDVTQPAVGQRNEQEEQSERVQRAGEGVLGDVPAGGAEGDRRDDAAGEVVRGAERGDRGTDRGLPGRLQGAAGAGGGLPRSDAADQHGDDEGTGEGPARDAVQPAEGAGHGEQGDADGDAAEDRSRVTFGSAEQEQTAPQYQPPEDGHTVVPSGVLARVKANIAAIEVLRRLQDENRPATASEQETLARWSGWGATPQVFVDSPKPEFAPLQRRLRELLSDSEYEAAQDNTLNAHYTDPAIAQQVWKAVRELGFDGGNVLEPGSGSGNFIGYAPEHAHMTGVELDPITAGIAKALYPHADIRNEGFEKTRAANGTFDLAVGNVPFGDYQVVDMRHNKGGHNIHNHFILKSLDLTRPGGLVAVVTSRYTMDGATPRAEDARMEMARKADLVGAIRLPSGAHRRTAGTDVVTDLLIFRRREKDKDFTSGRTRNGEIKPPEQRKQDDPPTWVHSVRVNDLPGQDPDDKEAPKVHVNPYFLERPRNVLGDMHVGDGMYGPGELRVHVAGDLNEELGHTLKRVVDRAKDARLTYKPDTGDRRKVELLSADSQRPDGHVELHSDGTLTQVRDGMIHPYDVPKTQIEEAKQLLGLRDSMRALVREESRPDADENLIETLRADLKARYDKYNAKFGAVNRFDWAKRKTTDPETGQQVEKAYRKRPPMGGLLSKDPTMAVILSLDSYDENTKTSTPAAIFTKRQSRHRTIAERASSPEDAMAIVLEQRGTLNIDALADVMGVSPESARERLLAARSKDPETGDEYPLVFEPHDRGDLIPAAEYLSGNVREKLEQAQTLAGQDSRFEINVKHLEDVLPEEISPGEIDAPMGASWLGRDPVQAFLREKLETDAVTVSYQGGSMWKVDAPEHVIKSQAARSIWGTKGFNAVKLAEAILTNGRIRVTYRGDDDKTYVDEDATAAAQTKAEEMREEFQDWLWATEERTEQIKKRYNDLHNNLALRSYDGQRRTMPGLAEWFKPHAHQHAAVARMVNEPAVLLAHEVGAGKTAEMAMGVMELRRLGMVNKAAIVVPNHMLNQFRDEFAELYPESATNGRILAASSDDLQGRKRREFIARVATGDYDAVILTQNAFESIPMRPEVQLAYIEREKKQLQESLKRQKQEEAEGNPGKRADSRMVKDIRNRLKKLEAKIQAKLTAQKDMAGLYFEDTGIDYVVVDEAHHYKNLSTNSTLPGAAIEGSNRASDLDMKLEYLRNTTKSGRVVTFATATPISNSITEAHTMLRYLRPDLLDKAKIRNFDDFASTYGKVVSGTELAADGSGFREVSRFAAFRNMPELLRIWRTVADVKNSDDLAEYLDTPDVAGGKAVTISVEPTDGLVDYMEEIAYRAKKVKDGQVDPKDDNMLKINSDGRKVSLDPRMVGIDEQGAKLPAAADNIARIHADTKDAVYPSSKNNPTPHETPGGLQIVFLDMGTPTDPGKSKKKKGKAEGPASLEEMGQSKFPAYQELKALLVERGVPAEKIRFIHEAKNDAEKSRLFADARNGKISVLVGSTTKMGVGTNVQLRATALHHLDCPWRPADLEQRNGRIIRQGNANPEVAIFQYVTEGSFDGFSWQTVARKAKFIRQIMKGNLTERTVEDIPDGVFNAEQVTAISTGNPYLLEQANVKVALGSLRRKHKGYMRTIEGYKSTIRSAERTKKYTDELTAQLRGVLARRKNTRGDAFNATIGNTDFTKRDKAAKALRTAALAVLRRGAEDPYRRGGHPEVIIGKVGNIDVVAQYRAGYNLSGRVPLVDIHIADVPQTTYTYDEKDLKKDSTLPLTRIEDRLADIDKAIVRLESRLRQEERAAATARERMDRPFEDADQLEAAERRSKLIAAIIKEQGQAVSSPDAAQEKRNRMEALEHQLREARLAAGEKAANVDDPTAEQDTDLLPRTPAAPSISTDEKGRTRITWPDAEARKAAKERKREEKRRQARKARGETEADPEKVSDDREEPGKVAPPAGSKEPSDDSVSDTEPSSEAAGGIVKLDAGQVRSELAGLKPENVGAPEETAPAQDDAAPEPAAQTGAGSVEINDLFTDSKLDNTTAVDGLKRAYQGQFPEDEDARDRVRQLADELFNFLDQQWGEAAGGVFGPASETALHLAQSLHDQEMTPEEREGSFGKHVGAVAEALRQRRAQLSTETPSEGPQSLDVEKDSENNDTSAETPAAQPAKTPGPVPNASSSEEGRPEEQELPASRTPRKPGTPRTPRPAGEQERPATAPRPQPAQQPVPADMTAGQLADAIDDVQSDLAPLAESTDPLDLAMRRRLEQHLWELEDEERRRWKPEPKYDNGKLVERSREDVVRDRLAGYGLNDAEVQGLVTRVEDLPEAKAGGYADEEWERISADASAREDYPPTDEQNIIIQGAARRGLNMAVMALAGTGKSSTLKMLSHRMPGKKIVYLAFNRSVAAEAREAQARGEYAKNMLASTANAYAARVADRRLNARLPSSKAGGFKKLSAQQIADRMRWYDTVKAGNRDLTPGGAASVAERMLREWAKSADAEMGPQHIRAKVEGDPRELFNAVKPLADRMWANLSDPEAGDPDRDLPMDFDYIVKQWALGGYKIDADTLFWDEAQDVNPVMEGVVRAALDQGVQVVAVGDSNQAIYGFRGASDALAKLPVDARATLTQSFRFGPAVADVGNRFLRLLGTRMRLKGFDRKNSRIGQLAPGEESMVIARTNAGVALAAVQALTAGRTVAVSGGVKALQEFVQAAHALAEGEDTDHAELARFNGMAFDDIVEEVKADPDLQQLASLFNLLEKHGDDIDALLSSGSRPAATELVGDRVWVHLDWNDPHAGDLKRWLGDGKNNGVGKLLYDPATRRYYYEPGKREVPWKSKTRSGVYKIDNKLSLEEAQQRIDAHLEELYPQDDADDGSGRLVPEHEPHDVLVTTAHKAKGLESERVRIADDFKGPAENNDGNIDWDTIPDDEALRVAYVAVTRATEVLDPGSLGWVFRAVNDDDPTQPPKGEYRRDFKLDDFQIGDQVDFDDEDGTPNIGTVSEIDPPLLTVVSTSEEPGVGGKRQDVSPAQVRRRNGQARPLLPAATDGELDQAIAERRYGPEGTTTLSPQRVRNDLANLNNDDTSTPKPEENPGTPAPAETSTPTAGPEQNLPAKDDQVMTPDGPGEVMVVHDGSVLVRGENSTRVWPLKDVTRPDGTPFGGDRGGKDTKARQNAEDIAKASTREGLELSTGNRLRDLDVEAGHGTIVDGDGNTIGWVRARIGDNGRRYWWGQDADGGAPADMQWHEELPDQAGAAPVRAASIVRDGLDFLRQKYTGGTAENGKPEKAKRKLVTPDRAVTNMTLTPAQVRELGKLTLSGNYADGEPIDTLPWNAGHRIYSPYSAQAGALAAAAREAAARMDESTPQGRRNKKVLLGAARKMEFQQYDSARRAATIPAPGEADAYDKPYVPRAEDPEVDAPAAPSADEPATAESFENDEEWRAAMVPLDAAEFQVRRAARRTWATDDTPGSVDLLERAVLDALAAQEDNDHDQAEQRLTAARHHAAALLSSLEDDERQEMEQPLRRFLELVDAHLARHRATVDRRRSEDEQRPKIEEAAGEQNRQATQGSAAGQPNTTDTDDTQVLDPVQAEEGDYVRVETQDTDGNAVIRDGYLLAPPKQVTATRDDQRIKAWRLHVGDQPDDEPSPDNALTILPDEKVERLTAPVKPRNDDEEHPGRTSSDTDDERSDRDERRSTRRRSRDGADALQGADAPSGSPGNVPNLAFPHLQTRRADEVRDWAGLWATPQPNGVRNVFLDRAAAQNPHWTDRVDPWDVRQWISTLADVDPMGQFEENERRNLGEVPQEARGFLAGLASELRASSLKRGNELVGEIRPILREHIATRKGREKADDELNELTRKAVNEAHEEVRAFIARARAGAAEHGLTEQQAEDFILDLVGGDNPGEVSYGLNAVYPEVLRPLASAVNDGHAYMSAFGGWASMDDSHGFSGWSAENRRRAAVGAPMVPAADPATRTGDIVAGEAELPKGMRWVKGSELRQGDIFHSPEAQGAGKIFVGLASPQYVIHLHRGGREGVVRSVNLDPDNGHDRVQPDSWVVLVEKPEPAVRKKAQQRARADTYTAAELLTDEEMYELGGPDRVQELAGRAEIVPADESTSMIRGTWLVKVDGVEVGRFDNTDNLSAYTAVTPDGQRSIWHEPELAAAGLVLAHNKAAGDTSRTEGSEGENDGDRQDGTGGITSSGPAASHEGEADTNTSRGDRSGTVDGRRVPTEEEMQKYETGPNRVVNEEGERVLFGSPERMRELAGEGVVPTPGVRSDDGEQVWRNGRLIGSLSAPHLASPYPDIVGESWNSEPPFSTLGTSFTSREAAIANLVLRDREHGEPDLKAVRPDLARSLGNAVGLAFPSKDTPFRGLETLAGNPADLERYHALRALVSELGRGVTPAGDVAADLAHLHDELLWLDSSHYKHQKPGRNEAGILGPGWFADEISEYLDVLRPEDPRAKHHVVSKDRAARQYVDGLTQNGGLENAETVPVADIHAGDVVQLHGRMTGFYPGYTNRRLGYVVGDPKKVTFKEAGVKHKGYRVNVTEDPFQAARGRLEPHTFIIPADGGTGLRLARAEDVDLDFDQHHYGRQTGENPRPAAPDNDASEGAAGTSRPVPSVEPAEDRPAAPEAAVAPEPVGGRPAEWTQVSDLQLGDLVRVDGVTRQGTARTRAGHIVGGPVLIPVTRKGRATDMYRVLIADSPSARTGAPVYVLPNAAVARATREDTDQFQGAPQTGADADVLAGRIPDRVPTDAQGNGLFPGALVTDNDGKEGVVTGASADSVRVQFGNDRTDDAHSPTSLNVTDGGAARPSGWTADGRKVREGNVVGDQDGSRLGTVESIDGDTATVATPGGMKDMPIGDLRVIGDTEEDDTRNKVARVTPTPASKVQEGDVLVRQTPKGPRTARVTHREEQGDQTQLDLEDTTTGETTTLSTPNDTDVQRAEGADGAPPELGPEDAPTDDAEITTHEPEPAVAPVSGPTVDPQLSPEERDAIRERGQAPASDPEAQQATARVVNDLPVTPAQAAALAEELREGADSETPDGRAARRAADRLDAAAGNEPDDVDQPEPGTVGSVGEGDTITLPDEFDPDTMTAYRVVNVQAAPGGLRVLTVEDGDGLRFERTLASSEPLYQVPDPETPDAADNADQRDPNPAPHADRVRDDYTDAVVRAVVDSALEGTTTPGSIHQLRQQIAERLTPEAMRTAMRRARNGALAAVTDAGFQGKERDDLVRALRQDAARARTEAVRAAVRTLDDLEPLDGESEEDTASRAADLLRLIPQALHSRPDSADDTDGETSINDDVAQHADDAVSDALQAAADSGELLTPERRAEIVRQIAARLDSSRNAAAQRIASRLPEGQRARVLPQLVAGLAAIARKLIAVIGAFLKALARAWRAGRESLRRLRERISRFRRGLMRRIRSWPETRRLRRLAAPGVSAQQPDVLALGDRIAHWARLLPAPGRFGQVSRRARWYRPASRASLAAGQLPQVQDGVRWTPNRAADGGPGAQALRHLAAVRAAGQDVDTDVMNRLRGTAPELGDDPHETVRHAEQHAQAAERRLRDLEAAATGGAPGADLEAAAARAEAQSARQEAVRLQQAYAAALPKAVRDTLAEIREMGPGTTATLVTTPDSDPAAVRALADIAQFVPRDWLSPTEARFIGARTGEAGGYDPASRIATVADLGDAGRRTAAHALLAHLQQHYPDVLAAQQAFHFTRTRTGRVGARRRTPLDMLLARLFRNGTDQDTNRDLVPLGIAAMFDGDWYEDDDLRAFLLGLLATR
ncbi:UvrD-helicase domain-containing protein [Streptomyces sp. NPDC057249]|uniref:UvrD-helicase domain-containing protein n=1 Tax=Streptomyces sp. NPDC057249 TaxID=3346067 RepID=UPI0036417361